MSRFIVRKVAVLGAGVMGAQIAAHCANAGLQVLLFDLPAAGEDARSAPAARAIERLLRMEPPPLATARHAHSIEAMNYDDDLARLNECELVIEAVAERLDIKHELYARVAPHLREDAVLATNTSGLPVHALAQALPAALSARFCGIHFFNPPRYMALVELVAGPDTEPLRLDRIEAWLTTTLGKRVVRARDTPNFIANRIGVFSMLAAMHHTQRLKLGFDETDALTGPAIGRPKSATFRTADVVGLDTLARVIDTLRERLPNDPWHHCFVEPQWLSRLVERGALGAKSGEGVYFKLGREISVLDPQLDSYRPSGGRLAPEVLDLLSIEDPVERMAALRASAHPQADLLWSMFRDLFHYCAVHLGEIAGNAREIDVAMRWGFGWSKGPFETWQEAGWQATAEAIAADIAAGRAMSDVPLPAWVFARDGVHGPAGSYSVASDADRPRAALAVYLRQLSVERLVGEPPAERGETVWESAGVSLWRRPDQDPRIAILSLTSRVQAIGEEALEGMLEAVARAERDFDALVLWNEPRFAVGADLSQIAAACERGEFERLERMLGNFQRVSLALRDASVPVVTAIQGMALGGGCEFAMHAAHRVLALESYLGLVEAGVGLIPAGGGSAALAMEADRLARHTSSGDVFPFVEKFFRTVSQATVSRSALHAVELGFARSSDDVVMHVREVLYVALARARSLASVGWRPPLPGHEVVVAGREGIATLEMALLNLAEGGFISAHDRQVARATAVALCGGEVDRGTRVPESWLLAVERAQFMELLRTPETQARIRHMLETGKALRN